MDSLRITGEMVTPMPTAPLALRSRVRSAAVSPDETNVAICSVEPKVPLSPLFTWSTPSATTLALPLAARKST